MSLLRSDAKSTCMRQVGFNIRMLVFNEAIGEDKCKSEMVLVNPKVSHVNCFVPLHCSCECECVLRGDSLNVHWCIYQFHDPHRVPLCAAAALVLRRNGLRRRSVSFLPRYGNSMDMRPKECMSTAMIDMTHHL